MKFASLTTLIVSVALMAGVTTASEDLLVTPKGLACNNPDRAGCSTGIKGYNNQNDFGYFCGATGKIIGFAPCNCKNCCKVTGGGDDFTCKRASLNSNVPDPSDDVLAFASAWNN
ncbi:uncharacterized protein EDB91DRAFT_1076816 [Suillus paluster]|uniref:uncharacterized protein n=1 Tax=Suillus paluster TaxID=48578 RepID=UPI001B875594|nr:uncharacterized protein EDB91DRAFT_1076816 [Suillus paluster]KAG1756911.1 hypothetical protein EDB91DRAFT_1076816 [Suillus paluster]